MMFFLLYVAGMDWDGWQTSFAIGGCEYFEGLADGEDDLFTLIDGEIGKSHCDLFYANLGGYDDNVDITANEACIVCGACDVCTGKFAFYIRICLVRRPPSV
jgi:hypothetical protein